MSAAKELAPYELYIKLQSLRDIWAEENQTWPDEIVLKAGYHAVEMCFRLVDGILEDSRPEAFAQRRLRRVVDLAADGLEFIHSCVATYPPKGGPPTGATTCEVRPVSPGFRVLERMPRAEVRKIADRFAGSPLPFRVGVEEQIAAACALHDLPTPTSASDLPVLDYRAVIQPDVVYALRDEPPHGPEDLLFRTTHQITECWLRVALHHVKQAVSETDEERWQEASQRLDHAAWAARLAVAAGQLLEMMSLADYHPLRVRLRDGSGAQSVAAHQLVGCPDPRGISLCDVIDSPSDDLELYRYLCAVKAMAKVCQSFLFHHYMLVLDVLGTQTHGSLGYEVQQMAQRVIMPRIQEINQAQHELAMITNLRYAPTAGTVILADELATGRDYTLKESSSKKESAPCPGQLVQAQIDSYFRAIEDRDVEGWVNLFDPVRGTMIDLAGTRPFVGRGRLRVFITAMFQMFTRMRPTYSVSSISGNTAHVAWHFDVTSFLETQTEFSGIETFTFRSDGLVLRAEADWDPYSVAQRIWTNSTSHWRPAHD
jgi:hypothetical protein